MTDNEVFERLYQAVEDAQRARRTHVAKVLIIGDPSEPLEMPAQQADREWFAEYRALRDAEVRAEQALDDYFAHRFGA